MCQNFRHSENSSGIYSRLKFNLLYYFPFMSDFNFIQNRTSALAWVKIGRPILNEMKFKIGRNIYNLYWDGEDCTCAFEDAVLSVWGFHALHTMSGTRWGIESSGRWLNVLVLWLWWNCCKSWNLNALRRHSGVALYLNSTAATSLSTLP